MSTSGTYNFAVNRDQIIRQALLFIRKLDELETPTPTETTDCANVLNMICKQWQGKTDFAPGLKTWTRIHAKLFLNSTTGAYTIGPNATGWTANHVQTYVASAVSSGATVIPVTSSAGMLQGDFFGLQLSTGNLFWTTVSSISGNNITIANPITASANSNGVVYDYTTTAQQPVVVETAVLRDINKEDIPLRLLTLEEYDWLPSKKDPTNISDPTAIYVEFQLGNSNLYTDCGAAQDVTKHIAMTCMTAVQDFNNPTDTPYYPQEWYLALAWELARNIAPMYGALFTPDMKEARNEAIRNAREKEPERSSLYFQCGEDGR